MTSIKQTGINPVHNSIQQNASDKNSISGATVPNSQRQVGNVQTQSGATVSSPISQRQTGHIQTQSGATVSNSQRQVGNVQTQSRAAVSNSISQRSSQRQTGNIQTQQDTFSQQTSHKLSNSSQFKSAIQLDAPQGQTGVNIRTQGILPKSAKESLLENSTIKASDIKNFNEDSHIAGSLFIEDVAELKTLKLPKLDNVEFGAYINIPSSEHQLVVFNDLSVVAPHEHFGTQVEKEIRDFIQNNDLDPNIAWRNHDGSLLNLDSTLLTEDPPPDFPDLPEIPDLP